MLSRPPTSPQRRVSTELRDALGSTLLHLTLAPHHSPPPLPSPIASHSLSSPSTTSHLHRHKSIEDLRVAPPFTRGPSPAAAKGTGAGPRRRDERSTGAGGSTTEDYFHPFADSGGLLRRCASEVRLEHDLDEGDEEGEESDFESDEEPFKLRPRTASLSSVASGSSSRFGVRIEDRSDRESSCFARDASIRSFYPVGEKAGGFVVFVCEVTSREGTLIRTLKRYSAFVRLRGELARTFPHLLLPRLPPKSSLSKFRQSFLERRRQQLSFWLTTVLLHPETGGCEAVRAWILEA